MREHDRKRAGLLAPVKSALDGLQADWEKRLLEVETNPEADFAWQRALEVLGLQRCPKLCSKNQDGAAACRACAAYDGSANWVRIGGCEPLFHALCEL
jgi:hypothetical protein